MQLLGRMLATVAAIILLALFVFVGIATLQYNAILSDLTRERLMVLSDTVRAPFQSVADLGVPIGTMRNAEAVLERARASDEAIVAIHVMAADGSIARSTAAKPPEGAEAVSLRAAQKGSKSTNWHLETIDSFLVGTNIADATGKHAGAILIKYSKRDANTQLQAMVARLVLLAGAVFAVSLLLVLGVLRVVLSEHLRIFDGILASFDDFERRFWRGSGVESGRGMDVAGLGVSTFEFNNLMERSEAQYQRLKQDDHSSETGPGT
jgi:hypothetical protein